MRLDTGRFAIAVATVWAIAGLLCAFVFKTAPAVYFGAANFLLHSDMYRAPARTIGWGELLIAAALWWVLVAVLAGASATLYNRMAARSARAAVRTAA